MNQRENKNEYCARAGNGNVLRNTLRLSQLRIINDAE
ncbi:hypothetical protein EL75_0625 [Escherichia coli]|uniref:Putative transcriptional regulator YgiP n=1 Tax=Escherichia coli TA447 TaxID=656447 RepID=A0A1X3IYB9_ECOLX|nr:hypothetical protein EL75_0625 [Escherichia coli]OSK92807.1 putative transcriptional regulator YgiP [Escherichia coli TA447]OSL60344.1 putative transcriptional regulator YgiP [Escherichia coli H420]OSL69727.1 putative transcriptional regulator YgiP [Escherichia coli TA008]OSL82946.1 putative transcriptional regulator YgiP [Escherichia coli TA249]